MLEPVIPKEKRATPKKVALYLIAITFLGSFGVFLVGAVVRSGYFDGANALSFRAFFARRILLETAVVSVIGMLGVAMSYVAVKLADELWDMLRNKKAVSL